MKMKLLSIATIFILFTNSLGANETTTQILPYINQLRNQAGLIPLEADKIPAKAADNHANYLANEKDLQSYHTETNKKNPYYTAKNPWDRMKMYDYPITASGENVSWNDANLTASVNGLFVSIFHRLNFLSLKLNRLGSAVAYDANHAPYFVYDLATKSPQYYPDIQAQNPKITLWPPRDYQKAQPVFDNTESPAPLPECARGGNSGNPISIQFNPQKSGAIDYQTFTLTDPSGKTLTIKRLISKHIDDHTLVFFPVNRLEWDTTYTAHLAYLEDGAPKTIDWSFKTRSLPDYPIIRLTSKDKRYQVASGSHYILYLPPKDCTVYYNGYGTNNVNSASVEKIYDSNTIQIDVRGNTGDSFEISIGRNDKFTFDIFTHEIEALTFSDISTDSVTLHWKHTSTGNETGYKIFRDGKLIYTASINDRSYIDTGLTPNHTYRYTVKVTDEIPQ